MKSEDKVPTLEQCKKLVELGVVLETEKMWVADTIVTKNPPYLTNPEFKYDIESIPGRVYNYYPAPDVAELGELLPEIVKNDPESYTMCQEYDYMTKQFGISWDNSMELLGNKIHWAKTEAQARCAALIWLIENDHLNPKDL